MGEVISLKNWKDKAEIKSLTAAFDEYNSGLSKEEKILLLESGIKELEVELDVIAQELVLLQDLIKHVKGE